MSKRIRLEGIYDLETHKSLKTMEIQDFLFDLRPLELNFIQQYRLLEILNTKFNPQDRYFLHFKNEKDFVIQKILDDLKDFKHPFANNTANFFLEFSDNKDVDYYEQFGHLFYWHYDWDGPVHDLLKSPLLQGLVINASFLMQLDGGDNLDHFFQALQEFKRKRDNRSLEIVLRTDWNFDQMEFFSQQFPFDMLSCPINREVESNYRVVNWDKLAEKLDTLKQSLEL